MKIKDYSNNSEDSNNEIVERARRAFAELKRRNGGNDGGVSPYPKLNPNPPKPNRGGGVPVVKTKKPELV